jgi:hypothetical protein
MYACVHNLHTSVCVWRRAWFDGLTCVGISVKVPTGTYHSEETTWFPDESPKTEQRLTGNRHTQCGIVHQPQATCHYHILYVQSQRGPTVTSLVARSSRGRCDITSCVTLCARFTRHIRESGKCCAHLPHNKGYYFWTPRVIKVQITTNMITIWGSGDLHVGYFKIWWWTSMSTEAHTESNECWNFGSVTVIWAKRVNVVLGIYKHYPGSISSLIQYPGYTSLSRTLPIVIRYLHSRLSRAWLWSRDRLKENGGDGVMFLVTTEILGIPRTTFTLSALFDRWGSTLFWRQRATNEMQ